MKKLSIREIEFYLPENVVTNDQLADLNPEWDMKKVENSTGVYSRHIAKDDETALDLAVEACKKLGNKISSADAIIFCTQSPDHIMPPNSCILHDLLGLPDTVLSFDFNLACSGYIYGLAMAEGILLSGRCKNILSVTGDTYSKYVNKKDRSGMVLFGDGASASILTLSDGGNAILDIECATRGKGYDKFIIKAGGCRMPKSEITREVRRDKSGNFRSDEDICMDGMGILTFVNSAVPRQVNAVLKRNDLKIEDISLFVFHQASGMVLRSLTRLLKIDPEKVFKNIGRTGNIVSSSIPAALKEARDSGALKPKDKVILSGFGVGLSYATALMEV